MRSGVNTSVCLRHPVTLSHRRITFWKPGRAPWQGVELHGPAHRPLIDLNSSEPLFSSGGYAPQGELENKVSLEYQSSERARCDMGSFLLDLEAKRKFLFSSLEIVVNRERINLCYKQINICYQISSRTKGPAGEGVELEVRPSSNWFDEECNSKLVSSRSSN